LIYSSRWPRLCNCWDFERILRYKIFGRTSMDEWSARSRFLYLAMHNTHKWQTFIFRRNSSSQFQQSSGQNSRPRSRGLQLNISFEKVLQKTKFSSTRVIPDLGFRKVGLLTRVSIYFRVAIRAQNYVRKTEFSTSQIYLIAGWITNTERNGF
jgi:hypothetical protein